jgi:hypothetical protein
MGKTALRFLFLLGLLVLVLGAWIGASYILHGVPPNEEEEAMLLKVACAALILGGGVACAVTSTILFGTRQ